MTTLLQGKPSLGNALVVAAVATVALAAVAYALLTSEAPEYKFVFGIAILVFAVLIIPMQLLDVRSRRHVLTDTGLIYRSGVLQTFELEVPYKNIQAVSVHQGLLQRLFGCGDVRISAQGISGPVLISHRDQNGICIRSIPDFRQVANIIGERLTA